MENRAGKLPWKFPGKRNGGCPIEDWLKVFLAANTNEINCDGKGEEIILWGVRDGKAIFVFAEKSIGENCFREIFWPDLFAGTFRIKIQIFNRLKIRPL